MTDNPHNLILSKCLSEIVRHSKSASFVYLPVLYQSPAVIYFWGILVYVLVICPAAADRFVIGINRYFSNFPPVDIKFGLQYFFLFAEKWSQFVPGFWKHWWLIFNRFNFVFIRGSPYSLPEPVSCYIVIMNFFLFLAGQFRY